MSACTVANANRFTDQHAPAELRAQIAMRPDGDVANIYRLWNSYLKSPTGSSPCEPSPYWVASEQREVTLANGITVSRCRDLARFVLWPRDQQHEVIGIDPVRGSHPTEYRITARFKSAESQNSSTIPRISLVTVYATREGNEWKLAGALGHTTRSWRRETVGPITYYVAPGRDFSRARAEAAVAFADSLSVAFGVPRLQPIDYYMVSDADAMLRLYGLESDTTYGTPGGQSLPGMIVSGDPVFGEKHGHQIAHTVLLPIYGQRQHVIASEGVPTWLGGTRGMHYPVALRALRGYLLMHPQATLDTVISDNRSVMHNPGAALLAAMVHEHSGVEGIRRFYEIGPSLDEFKRGVERILQKTWSEIAQEWKTRAISHRSPLWYDSV